MSKQVRITDVSPRDGLQNEPIVIPAERKVRLIELLSRTGVDEIEVTSFVSPKWVPQLADAEEVAEAVESAYSANTVFSALVPNARGLERVLHINETAGFPLISKVSVFTAASETFSQRNTNATIAETIDRFRPVVESARASNLDLRGYISCAIACPFEGPIKPEKVAQVAFILYDMGIHEIDLGDTIGVAYPADIAALLSAVFMNFDEEDAEYAKFTLHLHDTFGRAADCVRTALEMGVRSFDGSAAGLGGCPYASKPGAPAPGNIATELLVRTIHAAGYETNVDLDALAAASAYAAKIVADSRATGTHA
ncbi:MAG: hydroxymethylglutaryl-CoA lyase [Phycisphaeraceae bacterium]|nr:hydroxymethylglutaryl-CoA lyase [Phycisphaerales bacterium]MCB9844110.1 hydroxymethylglutaryl-CoA lyase [Phycisphaeraceae bacterium]